MRGMVLVGLLWLSAQAVAETLTRQQLEASIDAAAAVRLADRELEQARWRRRQADAEHGLKLFGSARVGSVRDIVDENSVRRYEAINGQVGIRLPLFGSRETEERDRIAARDSVEQRQLRLDSVRREAVRRLRRAYFEYLYRGRQAEVAERWLASEEETERVLHRRVEAGLLLRADALEMSSGFQVARRNQAVQRGEQAAARRRLEHLVERRLDGLQAVPGSLSVACLDAGRVRESALGHPEVRYRGSVLEERRRQLQASGASLAEAGVFAAQDVIKEFGGRTGGATYVGIDFRTPLDAGGVADARKAQAMIEVDKADLSLRQAREETEQTAATALDWMRSREEGLAFAALRLDAAREALRVARLRAARIEGDTLERYVMARSAAYAVATDYLEARLALELARTDLVAIATECADAAEPGESLPDLLGLLSEPVSVGRADVALATGLRLADTLALPGRFDESVRPGWYAWTGMRLMGREDKLFWRTLGAQSRRILVSFTRAELDALRDAAQSRRLADGIARARQAGLRVEALLGEPTWVMPARRDDLLGTVRTLSAFEFDGLHLDLERSQLASNHQSAWDKWIVSTVGAVREAWPRAIGLSVHHRDARPQLMNALAKAGLDELSVMAYVRDGNRAAEIAERVLGHGTPLRVSLAQSVERELGPAESYAGTGRSAALEAWRKVDDRLARWPRYAGLIVQSLEQFEEMAP